MFSKLLRVTIVILFSAVFLDTVAASDFTGVKVSVRIESFDKTIVSREVYAYTVSDALKAVSRDSGGEISIDAVYTPPIQIYSINGIADKHFLGVDGWAAYIERNGELIMGLLMDAALKEGDKLVIYYGEFTKTELLTAVKLDADKNNAAFTLEAQSANWVQVDGNWSLDNSAKPVSDARINVKQPNGNYKILKTNADGVAKTSLDQLGVYTYRVEKYNPDDVPSIVASDRLYYFHGLSDRNQATRGEAAAFIVNTLGIKPAVVSESFIDVPENHEHYTQIMTASSNGIISGTGDGFFNPDEPVNMAGLCVMLCNALGIEVDNIVQYKLIPEWAQKGVNGAIMSGLLNGITFDWNGVVKDDTLISIYKNYSSIR